MYNEEHLVLSRDASTAKFHEAAHRPRAERCTHRSVQIFASLTDGTALKATLVGGAYVAQVSVCEGDGRSLACRGKLKLVTPALSLVACYNHLAPPIKTSLNLHHCPHLSGVRVKDTMRNRSVHPTHLYLHTLLA